MVTPPEKPQQNEQNKGPDQNTIDQILYISGCSGKPPQDEKKRVE